jgi:hypothetical protein
MRRILAVLSASLLAFTITATPAPAADLGMPLKAPPIVAAPAEVDFLPLAVALLIATGVGLCIALCFEEHHAAVVAPVSPGATALKD